MFLAHFSSTPLNQLLEMEISELYWWHNEAVKLYNKINKQE